MAQEIADSTLLDTWSSGGNIVEPDISKIIEGWQLGEQPPHEYMNWLQNTFGSKLNHILKNGVATWNNETEYLAGSSVQHNGNVWLCKATNTNSEPTDVNSNWKRIITVESLTTVLGGYVKQSANLSDLTNAATARTNLGLGTAATRNVGTSSGQVMEVGAFGLGLSTPAPQSMDYDVESQSPSKFFTAANAATPAPGPGERAVLNITYNAAPNQYRGAQLACRSTLNEFDMRSVNETGNAGWVRLHHTGNILTTTGQSTQFPMTQKAVTDALDFINRIGLIDYGYVAKSYHIVAFGGEFNRADYPKLWAYLQANPSLVKTQAQWTTENTTNGGICGFFSSGNGTTTFRVPNLDKAFLRPDSRTIGSFQEGSYTTGDPDSASPVVTTLMNYDNNASALRSRMNWDNITTVSIGATNLMSAYVPTGSSVNYQVSPDAFGVTRPKNIAVLPLIVAK